VGLAPAGAVSRKSYATASPAGSASPTAVASLQAAKDDAGRKAAWDAFDRADEAIEAGAAVARRALPRIQKYLDRAEAGSAGLEADLQSVLMLAEAVR